jgi:hypothetical protein
MFKLMVQACLLTRSLSLSLSLSLFLFSRHISFTLLALPIQPLSMESPRRSLKATRLRAIKCQLIMQKSADCIALPLSFSFFRQFLSFPVPDLIYSFDFGESTVRQSCNHLPDLIAVTFAFELARIIFPSSSVVSTSHPCRTVFWGHNLFTLTNYDHLNHCDHCYQFDFTFIAINRPSCGAP